MRTLEVGLNPFCIARWPWTSGKWGVKCGGLDENVPHGLLYLNTCSPGGGAV